jgi:hypothetical protein
VLVEKVKFGSRNKVVSFDRIMEKLVILVGIMGVECLGFLSIFGEP